MSAKKDVKKIARLLLSIWLVSAILLNTGCSSFSDRTSVDSTESDSENATAESDDENSQTYVHLGYNDVLIQLNSQLSRLIEKNGDGFSQSLPEQFEAGRKVWFVREQTESGDPRDTVTAFATNISQGRESIDYTEPVLQIPHAVFLQAQSALAQQTIFPEWFSLSEEESEDPADQNNSFRVKSYQGFCGTNWFMVIPREKEDATMDKLLRRLRTLWVTADGEKWHELTTYEEKDGVLKKPLYEVTGACVLSEQIAFVCGYKSSEVNFGLIVTRDGGETWTDLGLIPPQGSLDQPGFNSILGPVFKGSYGICRVYSIMYGSFGYFFTDDGGFHWTFVDDSEGS